MQAVEQRPHPGREHDGVVGLRMLHDGKSCARAIRPVEHDRQPNATMQGSIPNPRDTATRSPSLQPDARFTARSASHVGLALRTGLILRANPFPTTSGIRTNISPNGEKLVFITDDAIVEARLPDLSVERFPSRSLYPADVGVRRLRLEPMDDIRERCEAGAVSRHQTKQNVDVIGHHDPFGELDPRKSFRKRTNIVVYHAARLGQFHAIVCYCPQEFCRSIRPKRNEVHVRKTVIVAGESLTLPSIEWVSQGCPFHSADQSRPDSSWAETFVGRAQRGSPPNMCHGSVMRFSIATPRRRRDSGDPSSRAGRP